MSDTPVLETKAPEDIEGAFLKTLVLLFRAEDTYGAWDGKSDEVILSPFILDKEARTAIPIIGDPDPDTLWRLELFYKAVGITIEKMTGVMGSTMMKMSHEGFGRIVLLCGRLVVVSKTLRDVHRFGFPSLEKLTTDGARLVREAIGLIEAHPDVARM